MAAKIQTAQAVIIGGGIQGLSLAYHLARRGLTDVRLIEMNTLGSGSSGRSAAIIGLAFQPEACLPLTLRSLEMVHRFREEMGADPGYEPIGSLLLAGAQSVSQLRRRHARLEELGVESVLVDRREMDRLTPGLNLADIEIGLYLPHEGNLDPHSMMMAYARQARRLGVTIVEGVRAVGLEVVGGRVVGVRTTAGRIATPLVVNAAGFRARQVAAWTGQDLPIVNLKRHIFFTGPVPLYDRLIPFTYDWDAAWYIRREGPGMLIGMGATESDEEDPVVDWSFLDEIGAYTEHRAPALADAGIRSGWAGLRPVTPDENPILGPSPLVEGFWNDCGWGGHGIMHAPAAGEALAAWIVDGEPSCCFGEGVDDGG